MRDEVQQLLASKTTGLQDILPFLELNSFWLTKQQGIKIYFLFRRSKVCGLRNNKASRYPFFFGAQQFLANETTGLQDILPFLELNSFWLTKQQGIKIYFLFRRSKVCGLRNNKASRYPFFFGAQQFLANETTRLQDILPFLELNSFWLRKQQGIKIYFLFRRSKVCGLRNNKASRYPSFFGAQQFLANETTGLQDILPFLELNSFWLTKQQGIKIYFLFRRSKVCGLRNNKASRYPFFFGAQQFLANETTRLQDILPFLELNSFWLRKQQGIKIYFLFRRSKVCGLRNNKASRYPSFFGDQQFLAKETTRHQDILPFVQFNSC
ncbi:hypothetical protein RRG08_016122 [Elysia crispata]|uniref:Uncharacterized protein n=1 Tax=Elysia crispata TaxID=231223 RepID=A0AAE1DJA3_9GAST|nr:hypothetical protein RRG08_016122 [Elysia crispata]